MSARDLIVRGYWVSDTLREVRWLARELPIGPTDVVLDVGSGSGPNLRSNVLCDKFPWDATERHGRAIALDRPFVVGDAERLPFGDRSFDFVICSHVLEHLEHPERAIAELQRVAPRGYIETPSAAWEQVAGLPFHRWMVSKRDGTLVFSAKRGPVEDPLLAGWFAGMQSSLGIGAYTWWRRRAAGVYTSHVWSGSIDVELHRDGAAAADGFVFADAADAGEAAGVAGFAGVAGVADGVRMPGRVGPVARSLARYGRHTRRHSDPLVADLTARLGCPACRGPLTASGANDYRCAACGTEFPSGGAPFPVLTPARTRPSSQSSGSPR
jgi:SAM-dependent methyltransferase